MKKLDFVIMILLPAVSALITFTFNTNLLTSVLLFLGLPAFYLALRNHGIAAKSFIFALFFSVPLSLFVDTLGAINGGWVVPTTIFPFRIFGAATVEVYLYGLLWVFFAVLFYEHFLDKGRSGDRISRKFKYLLYIFVLLILYVLTAFFTNKNLLYIPYYYLAVGIVFVLIPLFLFLRCYPKLFLKRFALMALYFFGFFLVFELASLHAHQWIFPGQFLGFTTFLGYRFPIEELILWMFFSTPALLAYYEFFADDQR